MHLLCCISICKKRFQKDTQLFNHLRKHHKTPVDFEYTCMDSKCGQIYQNYYNYRSHIQKHNQQTAKLSKQKSDISTIKNTYDSNQSTSGPQKLTKENIFEENDNYSYLSASSSLSNISEFFFDTPMEMDNDVEASQSILTQSDSNLFTITPNANREESETRSGLQNSLLRFSLSLQSKPNITRKNVIDIQKEVRENVIKPIVTDFKSFLQFLPENKQAEFRSCLDEIENAAEITKTEYRLTKYMERQLLFKKPIHFFSNNEIAEEVIIARSLDLTKFQGSLHDMSFQLKRFFECGDNLKITLNNIETLKTGPILSHFINAFYWNRKCQHFGNKIVLPIFLYADSFEINNNQGPHSEQVCGIYYSIPVIPNYCLSSEKNIFVAGFIKAKDLSSFGNHIGLSKLIEMLNHLEEEGILIQTKTQSTRIYFSLGQVLGDNLALKELLGFSKSFNINMLCRFCLMNKGETQTATREIPSKLRDRSNYNECIQEDTLKESGIRENSVFNSLNSFHVTDNISNDIMHDLYLGVCKYDLCHVLNYFIFEKKYFTLDELNDRKQNFPYGTYFSNNKSSPIRKNDITKKNLKMNAAEVKTFTHFILLMIGNFVKASDPVHKFLVVLIKILDIVHLSKFDEVTLDKLANLIADHNQMYIDLFNDTLKPKHHHLLHYVNIIKNSGPLTALWCFRFEAKHQVFKKYAQSVTSRINICYTLAIKTGMIFANSLLNNDFFHLEINYENHLKVTTKAQNYYDYLPYSVRDICEIQTIRKLSYKNLKFDVYNYISHENKIFRIEEMIMETGKPLLITRQIRVFFSQKYQSYKYLSDYEGFKIVYPDEIQNYSTEEVKLNDEIYIRFIQN
ncbi:uncharacterized protein LOC129802539 isoform X1 [Phlebotomus papatasi]|uniref:uncharacterized protein LOC129802539 isoform X1 n=1 Tax=Phlebotomus papatasi TaxID=29031 RepID=UPI002483737D|nr:uncharacterized protein LOC129802539 isoform X1 [Phlebotomus papatasi]XP_055704423.1 uncharacterized protein LOC129802539 isoform X1 [Phlebotomus papatasi]